jgi:hypothetical protein
MVFRKSDQILPRSGVFASITQPRINRRAKVNRVNFSESTRSLPAEPTGHGQDLRGPFPPYQSSIDLIDTKAREGVKGVRTQNQY